MINDKWNHKDEWKQGGKGFLITVSRHTAPQSSFDEGVNCWAVYAYIYPAHHHFSKFTGSDMWQDAALVMPLHSGPTFLRLHRDDEGKICSVQVGADYSHLHDDRFALYATPDDASEVFADAQELHDWLTLQGAMQ